MHYRVMDSDLCVSKTLELDALSFCFKRNCQLENITTYYTFITYYNSYYYLYLPLHYFLFFISFNISKFPLAICL